MKYNNETLISYCNDNNVTLLQNYCNININRDKYIEGKCKDCDNTFNKTFRQLVKTGAYCQNCIIKIGNNKIKLAKVKYDINILNDYCKNNNIILTNDYCNIYVTRDTIIEGMCLGNNCEKKFVKPLRQLLKIGGYCENCSKERGKDKIIETNLKKFGVQNAMQNGEIREKLKQTILTKYGVEHISKLENIKKHIKEKSLAKYGVEYVLQSPEVRELGIQTNLKKYGVKNPQQNKDIKEKTINTNLQRYGCKSSVGNKLIKEKIIKNNLEKYGVPHHSQNPEIAEKMFTASYNKKEYRLPSGKIIFLQGYEPFMLDHLLFNEGIKEDDIFTKRTEVPYISFIDKMGIKHGHYVDFYIKSQNRCIEVKSTWTNQEKNFVFEKQEYGKKMDIIMKFGFLIEMEIF